MSGRRLRIAMVIPTLDRSGAERQLALLASGLPTDRFEVRVIALTRGGPYADTLRQASVPVVVLGKRFRFDPFLMWRLRNELRSFGPDVVHTWLFSANSYGRLLSGTSRRWKVLVSERCVDTWKASWQLWLDRRLIPRTDLLVGNSNSVADFYRTLGVPPDRIRVVPNGVRVDAVSPLVRSEIRKEMGWAEDVPLVTYVGRLARQKRLEDLLWAFELLRVLRNGDCRFAIVGDGPERQTLEQFAERIGNRDYVAFTGHRPDAARFLAASDLFWLASDFEGQSNSLLEAMALGIPVVASDIPPNREVVEPGANGYLVPVGDRAAFSQAAQRLLENPAERNRLALAGHETIARGHSVGQMVASYAALYEELTGNSTSPVTPVQHP